MKIIHNLVIVCSLGLALAHPPKVSHNVLLKVATFLENTSDYL